MSIIDVSGNDKLNVPRKTEVKQTVFQAKWNDFRSPHEEHKKDSNFVSTVVGKFVLPAVWESEKSAKEALTKKLQSTEWWSGEMVEKNCLKLTTPDDIKLDALELIHQSQKNISPDKQKWILIFNSNGDLYEYTIGTMAAYGCNVGANILLFNYRGVGSSTGTPHHPNDLLIDGETCVLYLTSKGVKPENILLRGRSLGGAVAAQVRALYPEGPIIHDRSFSTLNKTIHAKYGKLAANLVKEAKWKMDTTQVWDTIKGDKVVVYHPKDQMISHQKASLEQYLVTHVQKNDKRTIKHDLENQMFKYKDSMKESDLKEITTTEYSDSHGKTTYIELKYIKIGNRNIDPHNENLEKHDATNIAIIAASKNCLGIR